MHSFLVNIPSYILKLLLMKANLASPFLILVSLFYCGIPQTTPIYGDSTQFASGQVTCDLSTGSTYTVTTPFTISTATHREPFYTSFMTTNNSIDSKQKFYYFMEMQSVNSTSFKMVHYSIVVNSVPAVYYGFNRPCLTGFRYMVVRSTFPDKFISLPLQIASTLWSITGGATYEILYNLSSLATTPPFTLNSTDTVFIHSLVNFRLLSNIGTLNNSIELTISFRVVNSTQFALQLKPKYSIKLDTLNDGSVRVFIYRKSDFDLLYTKIDYQTLTFTNLTVGSTNLTRTYVATFNPTNATQIVFGWNGMEFNGYALFGFEFSIGSTPTGLNYTITLTNRVTTSAIPRLDLLVLLPSEFRCPNNETLVNANLTLCYTACPAGTFQSTTLVGVTSIYICSACSSTCATCQGNSSNCTSCIASQNRVLSANTCVPMSGFYENGSAIAPPCNYTCLNCSVVATNCTACLASNFRTLSGNTCPANAGYYDSGVAMASACHYSCTTCVSNSTNCTSCNAANFRTLTANTCPPNTGYYDAGVATAAKCHYSCLTCSGNSTNCTSCSASSFRTLSAGKCVPNSGYFDNGTLIAVACNYTCLTCNVTSTNCTSCNSANFRTLSASNTCDPNPGYFDNGSATASPCNYTCQTCVNTSTQCTSCSSSNFRTLSGTTCPPNSGYFENGTAMAAKCSYTCLNCSVVATNCTACLASNFRTLSGNTCPANAGYYDSGVAMASACHYSCTTCVSNSTNCTSCSAANFRTLTSNSCPPNTGYYDAGVAMAAKCHYSCLTCSGNSTNCTSCSASSFRTLSAGKCVPNSGYFDNGTLIAVACNYTCLTCNVTSTNCTSCNSANFRTLSASNTCDPNPGYFDNGSATASPCNYTCQTCVNTSTQCTSCSSSNFRTLSGTTCPPNSGYFENGTAMATKCNTSCNTCTGTASNCTSCLTGFYLSANTCVSCSSQFGPNCAACIASKCSSCSPGYMLAANNLSCITCSSYHANCLTCTNSMCTSCDTSLKLALSSNNQTCFSCTIYDPMCELCNTTSCTGCHSGYMVSGNGTSCITCSFFHANCLTCNNTACTSCDASLKLALSMNSQTCISCTAHDPECVSCNFTTCLSCSSGYVVSSNNTGCITCSYYHAKCLTCNSSACLSCDQSLKFVLSVNSQTCISCTSFDSRCVNCTATRCNSCSGGFIVAPNNLSCIICAFYDSNCLTCNSSACTSCDANLKLALSLDGQSCISCTTFDPHCANCTATECSNCQNGFWLDSITISCSACSQICKTCSGSASSCTSCDTTTRTLSGTTCTCNSGIEDANGNCVSVCDQIQCDSCPTDKNVCQQCKPSFILSGGRCRCPSNTYFSLADTACYPCHNTCAICSGPSSKECTGCYSTQNRQINTTTFECDCKSTFYAPNNEDTCIKKPSTTCPQNYVTDSATGFCVQICGDGKLFELQCDDGNLENGDGCNSMCKVEANYSCQYGDAQSPSICSYNGRITFELISADKDMFGNAINIKYNLIPQLKFYQKFPNFTNSIRVSDPTLNIENAYFNVNTKTLEVRVAYNQSVTGKVVSISYTPTSSPYSHALESSSYDLPLRVGNGLSLTYYSKSTYILAQLSDYLTLGVFIGSLLVFVLALFFRKMIGVQIVILIQTQVISLSMLKEIHPVLGVLTKEKYAFGYNEFEKLMDVKMISQSTEKVGLYYAIGFSNIFGQNVNIMLFAIYVFYFLAILIGIISACKQKATAKKMKEAALILTRQIAFGLLIFSLMNMMTSYGLEKFTDTIWNYEPEFSGIMKIASIVVIVANYGVYGLYFKESVESYVFYDKRSRVAQLQPLFIATKAILISAGIVLYQHSGLLIMYGLMGIQGGYIILLIILRPFKLKADMIRSVIIELSLLYVIGSRYVLTEFVNLAKPGNWQPFLEYGLIGEHGLVTISLLISIVSLIFHLQTNGKDAKVSPEDAHSQLDSEDSKEKPKSYSKNEKQRNYPIQDFLDNYLEDGTRKYGSSKHRNELFFENEMKNNSMTKLINLSEIQGFDSKRKLNEKRMPHSMEIIEMDD